MKTSVLYIIVFLTMWLTIKAQVIYERTYNDGFPSIANSIELSDTSTFSIDWFRKCHDLRIRRVDQFGNSNDDWLGEVFLYGYHWIGHDSILLWYEEGAWDLQPDSFKVEVWTPHDKKVLVKEEVIHEYIPDRRYGAYLLRHDQIIYNKSDTFLRKNLVTGENDFFVFFQNTKNVIEFKNSLLIYFSSPFPKLVDADFNVIRNLHNPLPFDSTKAVVLDSFWIGRDLNDPLIINALNVFTESIRAIDFAILLDTLQDVQVNRGSLFVKGKMGNSNMVFEFNEKLEISQIHSLDLPNDSSNISCRYSPSRVYFNTTDGSGAYKADYRICYPYLDPHPIQYINIQLDSMWLGNIIDHASYSEIQVAFQISNLSADTIHSFTLHYENNEPESTCFTGTNAFHFADVSINPGDQKIYDYYDYTLNFVHGFPLIRTYVLEHGNYHLDSDTSNNSFQLIHLISGFEEINSDTFIIAPNPFTDHLLITAHSCKIDLALYDQMGRMVSRGQNQLDDLGDLPVGIYFLQVQVGKQFLVNKVVKME